ncbi:migration and invasion inhibitory protein isoform X2 [Cynoglossus semilaevis]|uniref:migration and invasion inhibitory protein isoform X2 n=1 Tax=Cynoglossus semilaevis TaxID=244447 RepID=UPI0004956A28|nr:migration and invasion-inhibitory protein isoform X2 [Cynoglossus semilaevis]
MAAVGQIDVLRERNKVLMNQLKEQNEKLERLRVHMRSWERDEEGEAEQRREAEEVTTLAGVDRRPARTALSKPTVRLSNTCGEQRDNQREASATRPTSGHQETDPPSVCTHGVPDSLQGTGSKGLKSCLVKNDKDQEVHRRVTFQSDDEGDSSSERGVHQVKPLLGYDWIAGVLDSEDTLTNQPDQFFDDLRVFRSLHKDECVHRRTAEPSETSRSGLETEKDEPQPIRDTHTCTFSYRINSRLFPSPLHSQERCPGCKKHKSSHPHSAAEPALISVSLPRSVLLPPYEYKPHRRGSFDPSDSLGLPSHCLSGWSHMAQSTAPPPSSLDLRSSLNTQTCAQALNQEVQDSSVFKRPTDQMLNLSKLARHNFQHFSPKRRRN